MSTFDLGANGSSGAPVNALAVFYKRPQQADFEQFTASDGSEWLKTGVIKPDADNRYPDATKFLGLWETGRPPLELTGYEVEVTGYITIPGGYIGYKLNYPETNSLELFWFDDKGLFTGSVQQVSVGANTQMIPFYDHVNQSVWCGARDNSYGSAITWKEFKDGTLTGNQFNWGAKPSSSSSEASYTLITTDDPDHYYGTITYHLLGQYDTVYCKVQKLRRSDRSVVAENQVQHTYTSASANGGNNLAYIASDFNRIVVNQCYYLSGSKYITYILDADLKLIEQFSRPSHMTMCYDFVHGEFIEAAEYKQVANTVGVESAKIDATTGYPIYVKIK